jgi:hypothetical protein
MNNNPHLMAILESKVAQVRTSLEHNNAAKAKSLLNEIRIYTEDMQVDIATNDRSGHHVSKV